MKLDVYSIGPGEAYTDNDHSFLSIYGIASSGVVLVRPDGFIAWRMRDVDPCMVDTLNDVLTRILHR